MTAVRQKAALSSPSQNRPHPCFAKKIAKRRAADSPPRVALKHANRSAAGVPVKPSALHKGTTEQTTPVSRLLSPLPARTRAPTPLESGPGEKGRQVGGNHNARLETPSSQPTRTSTSPPSTSTPRFRPSSSSPSLQYTHTHSMGASVVYQVPPASPDGTSDESNPPGAASCASPDPSCHAISTLPPCAVPSSVPSLISPPLTPKRSSLSTLGVLSPLLAT
jgi:hypothetical protein